MTNPIVLLYSYIKLFIVKVLYMFKYITRKIMSFKEIFKDSNDINEKNVVGFAAFAIMTLFALADIFTGLFMKDLVINEFIYNSFVIITLGCFGIDGIQKIASSKKDSAGE